MTATALAQCDACTPLGFAHYQRADEAAEWDEERAEWLCDVCRRRPKGVPAADGVYTDIDEISYHADKTSLSSSGARTLLDCPAIFHHERQHKPTPKPQYDMGHVVHGMVLGVGLDVVVVDAPDWKSKAAQDTRKEAHAAGKVPILAKDHATAQAMAKQVLEHDTAGALFSKGDPEVSGYWHDPETGIRCRFRTDWLHPGRNRIIAVDYKTSISASPVKFAKHCAEYGYHLQAAWYLDGLTETGAADDAIFVHVWQMKEPPYLVSVGEIAAEDIDRGRRLTRKALRTYADCLANDRWPGFGQGIHQLSLPGYARYQEEAQLA